MDATHPPRRSPVICALIPLGLLAVGAASPLPSLAADTPDGLLMASGTAGVRIYDPARDVVVFDFITDGVMARQGGCSAGTCFPLAAHHVIHKGVDFIDVGIVRYGVLNPDPRMWWPSVITRVKVDAAPVEIWTVRELDFRDVPERDSYCRQGDDEPWANPRNPGCFLSFVHGFQVLEDAPEENRVTLVTTDPWNNRILGLTLDYSGGNTAAHVDWVLGSQNPDWPLSAWPNHVQQVDGDDGERYLVSTFVAAEDTPWSAAPLIMWREDAVRGEWVQMWRHPDPDSGEMPFLQGSHMGEVLRDPQTGRQVIWYNHGRGLASGWNNDFNTDLGGTFGLLIPGATLGDTPSYAFDAELFSDDPTRGVNYARDVDFLEDGTLLLTDGACQSGGCPEEGGVYRVARFHDGARPSDRSGAFSADHSTQTLQPVPSSMVLEDYHCDFPWLFEAEWIPRRSMGRNLVTLGRRASQACYPEVDPPEGARFILPF